MLYLIDEKKVSRAYLNQAISALKFYYDRVLRKPKVVGKLPRPRRESTLPIVLSRAEVVRIFAALDNPKHRTLLMVAYSAGLRRGSKCSDVNGGGCPPGTNGSNGASV